MTTEHTDSNTIKLVSFLQKYANLSRRKASDIIMSGKVTVDTKKIDQISFLVDPKNNSISIAGKNIPVSSPTNNGHPEIVMFYKPKGYVVSHSDPHNKTIFELLPKEYQKGYYYIGRLDKDSHGLLLLTNEPLLVSYFEHPRAQIQKEYTVIITREVTKEEREKMKVGLWVDEHGAIFEDASGVGEGKTEFLQVKYIVYKNDKGKHVLSITLTSGKKRHIRRLLRAFGIGVVDLKRIRVGDFKLYEMKEETMLSRPVPKLLLTKAKDFT